MDSDNELLSQLSAGSRQAFVILYNRYWEKLFAIAYNRLKDIQDAEDVVHDVFESLWNNRKQAHITTLENYLASATKYLALARIKRKTYAKKYSDKNASVLNNEQPGADDAFHLRQVLNIVQTEINHLPEKCRLIFKYSREEGMSTKEIAKILSISPKTVDNQINKALRIIKLKIRDLMFFFIAL